MGREVRDREAERFQTNGEKFQTNGESKSNDNGMNGFSLSGGNQTRVNHAQLREDD